MVYVIKQRDFPEVGIGPTIEEAAIDFNNKTGDSFRFSNMEFCIMGEEVDITVTYKVTSKV